MKIQGGCYCKAIRYTAEGDALFQGQCHCRECQYVSGGHPNVVVGMPEATFSYDSGSPKEFSRSDLENPVTRVFCGECGTHLLTKTSNLPGAVLLKVGTFDDPSLFEGPQMVIFTKDKQAFHHIPEGCAAFEGLPG